ncbi:MAG: hypothetical protein CEE40_11580 [Chloroflexi bacterium B3_Chlor]|nr:MAG: hypothetical protein CEE40_11580 [Chloroflexi bacterium B3_Chlor]
MSASLLLILICFLWGAKMVSGKFPLEPQRPRARRAPLLDWQNVVARPYEVALEDTDLLNDVLHYWRQKNADTSPIG